MGRRDGPGRSPISRFVFDLDGCVWNGSVLETGCARGAGRAHGAGAPSAFSNNSRATGEDLRRRLLRPTSRAEHVVTPLDIIGEFIAEASGARGLS
jgi:ribonucleotide monophosphatase NagD (HAD superfamily)